MLAKVNKTYEQYHHYNSLVIVLLVRKIPKMKFLLPCTSSWQDLRWLRKYYRLEVQLAYLVNFAQLFLWFASHFFLHNKLVLHSFESPFSRIHIHLFIFNWSCTSTWQDLMRLRRYYQLEVQLAHLVDFAQFLTWFASHFTFLHSKLVLYLFESLFSTMSMILFIFLWSCTSSRLDPRGVGIYYWLEVQLAYLVHFDQFLLGFAPYFIFLHSKLQSYTTWNHFLQEYIYIYFYLVLYLQLVGS